MTVFMNVVALLAVLLPTPRTALGQAPPYCNPSNNGHHFCQDCKTGLRCGQSGPPYIFVTCNEPGEACAVVSGISSCVPLAQSPCSCDKPQQCDPYDYNSLLVCLNEDTTIITECPAQEKCINDACSTDPPVNPCEDVTGKKFVLLKPECTSAVYCQGEVSAGTYTCPAGQYFDLDIIACATSPPVPCEGGCTGLCPDKTDCRRYYVCDGSGHVDDTQHCDDQPAKPYFDPVSKRCQEKEALCARADGCVFSEAALKTI